MIVYNPYLRNSIDYPIDFESEELHFDICHETPFSEFRSEWCVSILSNGDKIYLPCGNNRNVNMYIVTRFYLNHTVRKPHGIYTIPITQFEEYKFS